MGKLNCRCGKCIASDRIRTKRRNRVVIGFVVVILLLVVAVIAASAQTPTPGVPLCFYDAQSIVKVNPARTPVSVATRTFGAPRTVDAVSYLWAIQGDTQPTTEYERAAVAVQYTITVNGNALRGMRLAAFVDSAPDMTIGQVVHNYIWSPNNAYRLNLGYYLLQAVSNNPCISEAIWPR